MSNCENSCSDEFEPKCIRRCPSITLLEAVAIIPQIVAAGLAVPFDANLASFGNGIVHIPGTTDFNLVQPGIYKVTFTGSVTAAALITNAAVAIAINGAIIPGTTVSETVVAAATAGLTTQLVVQVSPCINTILTIVNPTANTEIFTNPNVIIQRIG